MLQVTPYVTFKGNCRQAIDFYKAALGAEVLFSQKMGETPMPDIGPADYIMHATLKIGESTLMMSDNPNPNAPTDTSSMGLALQARDPEQAKRLFDKLAEEGTGVMPLQKTYWAELFGMVTDKFGVRWLVNCGAAQE